MSVIDVTTADDLVFVLRAERNGCWTWLGRVNASTGYGDGRFDGRREYAHRGVYELLVGLIPIGLTIDHLCRNRICANPDHLEPVSARVNILRSGNRAAFNARKTHCKWGHEFTAENTAIQVTRGIRQRLCRVCQRANARRYQARADYGLDLPATYFFDKTASEVRDEVAS